MPTPKRHHPNTPLRRFLRANRVELIALGVLAAGIFLMVEPFEIRATLMAWGLAVLHALDTAAGHLVIRLTELHPSDVLGSGMVLAAGGFIYWRWRYRLLRSDRLEANDCPRCHNPLRRVHRRPTDRFLTNALRLPLRRYYCKDCGWTGLRLRRHGEHISSGSHTALDPRP